MTTAAIGHSENPWAARLVLATRVAASLTVMSVGALLMLCVAIATAFRQRRFYSERIAGPMGKLLLRIFGVRFVLHAREPFPQRQVVYISNNVDHIEVLEDGLYQPPDPGPSKDRRKGRHGEILVRGGFSVQAPQGMVKVTIQEIMAEYA